MMQLRAGIVVFCVVGSLLGGCMVAKRPAPVVQRSPADVGVKTPQPAEAKPGTYIVKRGDTLYGIALDHGLDYRDLARWNSITNPAAIEVGQVLQVKDPAAAVAAAPPPATAPGEAVVTPYQTAPSVQGKEVGAGAVPPAVAIKPDPALDPSVVSEPKALKLPYSEAALAKLQAAPPAEAPAAAATAPAAPAERADAPAASDEPDAVAWGWPTKGKVLAGFNENGGPKGVQIAGEMGQAVVASAGGRVVYTGSGLRGYGNLVIIKHNNTYLSAYAHNRSVLVKQGENVAKGQKIAEMGNSDASRVMLHFEIRRLGKPVDPMKFLPPG